MGDFMWENIYTSAIVFIVFIISIFIIIQIFNYRTLKANRKYYKQLHENIKPGKEVMLNNGIYGKLVNIREKDVDLEISKGVIIKTDRFSIKQIIK